MAVATTYRASVLLAARDQAPALLRSLSTLARLGEDAGFEAVVVDDGSTDGTAELLGAIEGDLQALHEPESRGWGPAIDRAAAAAQADVLVLLREDAVPVDGWLDALLAELAGGAAVARATAARLDGSTAGGDDWACLAVRREAFAAVGGFAGTGRPGRAERPTLLAALRESGRAVADVPAAVVLLAGQP
jgi:glycosyltransferase involved in cell wall biosynthesis